METTQTSVFEDVSVYHQPVSPGLRFANYLVDTILFYVFFYGLMFLFGVIIQLTTGSAIELAEY